MKHGRYDNEYARMKQKAGFARARERERERDVEERIVDPKRIDQMHAEFTRMADELRAKEAKEHAEADARSTAHTLRANKLCTAREWQSAGIIPPERWRDAEGFPTLSISFLINIGWKFGVDEQGDKVLYLPPPKAPRKTREDYERERAEAQEDQIKETF